MGRALAGFLFLLVSLYGICHAQNTGRFSVLTAKALEQIEKYRFNEAINLLEEVWESDRSDPAVPENLALCYLYADRDADMARALMETAVAKGGKASFLMQHAHERLKVISAGTNDFCIGRLSVMPGRLIFIAANPEHSFNIDGNKLREVKHNKWFGSSEGVYHVRTLDGRNFDLRPRTSSTRETNLVMLFVDKYIRR